MKEFKNTILLSEEESIHPDIEKLAQYECILLPRSFDTIASQTIRLLYAPLNNVYYYNNYIL